MPIVQDTAVLPLRQLRCHLPLAGEDLGGSPGWNWLNIPLLCGAAIPRSMEPKLAGGLYRSDGETTGVRRDHGAARRYAAAARTGSLGHVARRYPG
ncbi:hypothetical protein D9602_02370 [Sphingomonas sp. TX0522]|nr:hypothetical protein [Sphingomonas sp. TX0522]